jgi:hypothetical protein
MIYIIDNKNDSTCYRKLFNSVGYMRIIICVLVMIKFFFLSSMQTQWPSTIKTQLSVSFVNDVICNCKYFYKIQCLGLTTCLHSIQSLAIVFNAIHDGSRFISFHYQLGQAYGICVLVMIKFFFLSSISL